jgi:ribonuclease HI
MKFYYGDLVFSSLDNPNMNEIAYKEKITTKSNITYHGILIPKDEAIYEIDRIKKATSMKNFALYDYDLYTIYCDGGSFNNTKKSDLPYFGSYGTIIFRNNEELKRLSGCTDKFTNNLGEITACLNGLKWIEDNTSSNITFIRVISDSQYVIKGSNEWINGWIKRGWKNNQNETLPNLEYWQKLYSFITNKKYHISFKWTKGHNNDNDVHSIMNEECDKLCNIEINNFIKSNYPELMNKQRKKFL